MLILLHAKQLKGSKGLEQVKEIFWEEAIDENGEMNRQYVGEIVLIILTYARLLMK